MQGIEALRRLIAGLLLVVTLCPPTLAQVVSEYPIPGIAGNTCSGPNAVYFTDATNNAIGELLPDGTAREWTIPTPNSSPAGCAYDQVRNRVYFTEQASYKVGALDLQHLNFFEWMSPLPHNGIAGLTFGGDGNLWIVAPSGSRVLHMTPSGQFLAPIILASGRWPHGPALGHDGNVWFAEFSGNRLATVSPAGVVREYVLPQANSKPFTAAPGPDGVYFTLNGVNKVTRISYTGTINQWSIPTLNTAPMGITLCDLDSNGNPQLVYFAESTVNKIGVMALGGGPISEYFSGAFPNKVTCGRADNRAYWSERGANNIGAMR